MHARKIYASDAPSPDHWKRLPLLFLNRSTSPSPSFETPKDGKLARPYLIAGMLLLILIWGLTWHLDRRAYAEQHSIISSETASQAGIYEAQMIRALREIDRILAVTAYAIEQHGPETALASLDAKGLLPPKMLFDVNVTNAQGKVIATNNRPDSQDAVSQADFLRMEQSHWPDGQVYVGHPNNSPHPAHNATVRFVRRIDATSHQHSGFIVVSVEPSYLVSAYDGSLLGQTATIGLMRHDGSLLAARTGERIFWDSREQGSKQPPPRESTVVQAQSPWDGRMRYASIRMLTVLREPLHVFVALGQDEQFKTYRSTQRSLINTATLMSVMSALFVLVAERLSRKVKLREQAIRQIEQTYHAASEASPDASYVLDALFDEKGQVQDFSLISTNSRGAYLLAMSQEGLQGLLMSQLLPAPRFDQVMAIFREVYASGIHFMADGRNPFPSVQAEWLSIEVVRVPRGLVVIATDIGARKQFELDMQRSNQELKAVNQQLTDTKDQLLHSERLASIGLLAAGVAHEINNPIGFVSSNVSTLNGYTQNLFDMLAHYQAITPHLPPQEQQALKALGETLEIEYLKTDIPDLLRETKDGLDRVGKIVADLKNFSRPESTHEWQDADIHAGIESTLNVINNEVKYKADVIKDFGPLPLVQCLPGEINQVIMNLVVNAAHAMGDKRGHITIRTRTIDEEALIEVEDDGRGMSEATLAKIFDPFFTTKPVGQGTGLGLSLSYGIIKKHGGRIDVDSQVGRGTRFSIHIPIRQPAVAATP